MNKLKEVLRYHIEGKSKREISKRTELFRNTVEKYLLVFESHPLTFKELLNLSDSELHSIVIQAVEVKQHSILKESRFVFLKNPENLHLKQAALFALISQGNYMVSQAWKIKEDFRALFGQADSTQALLILEKWFFSTKSYDINPVTKVVEMFKRHKQAIANALSNPDSNAYAERMNGSIQELKVVARGFRNIHNFRIAILFHHGKLNLFPTLNFL
jgi:hypothetical protein